ncbi:protein PNS1-like [Aristolochia californica]|uniref:protein PNS1-like n=1 Tax=Aristolochia californica TaxID=171875 RepID=UPI0035DF1542
MAKIEEVSRAEDERGGRGRQAYSSPRMNQISPNQAAVPITNQKTVRRRFSISVFPLLFSLHFLLIIILTAFLAIRGFNGGTRRRKFHPLHWFPQLLTSSACASAAALALLIATLHVPSKAPRIIFWLAPCLSVAASVLLLSIDSAGGLATGTLTLFFAIIQSLYGCWVTPRRSHAARILSAALLATVENSAVISAYVIVALLAGLIYSCLWIVGVGAAYETGGRFSGLFVFVLLLSLAWTMQVIKNVVHVAVAHVAYLRFSQGHTFDVQAAFADACTCSAGSICYGSCLVPVLGAVRGLARAMNLVAEDKDEFMFSCAHCYMGVADRLIRFGNRWGFVHVGAHEKGLVQASGDTWEMFDRLGMVRLVDTDLTASCCFLAGVSGGAVCTLVGGSWTLAVDKRLATSVSIYAFLIGYFMTRVAMAWPQACVAAQIVAYAENPQNPRFDSTIVDRIRQLHPPHDAV